MVAAAENCVDNSNCVTSNSKCVSNLGKRRYVKLENRYAKGP